MLCYTVGMHTHTQTHTHTLTAASHLLKPPWLQINALLPAGVRELHLVSIQREGERATYKGVGARGEHLGRADGKSADSYIKARFFSLYQFMIFMQILSQKITVSPRLQKAVFLLYVLLKFG